MKTKSVAKRFVGLILGLVMVNWSSGERRLSILPDATAGRPAAVGMTVPQAADVRVGTPAFP